MGPVRQVSVGEGAEPGSPQHRILGAEQSKEGICLAGLSSTEGWNLLKCWRHPKGVGCQSGLWKAFVCERGLRVIGAGAG